MNNNGERRLGMEELKKLDNYGHTRLESLTLAQLEEYSQLLSKHDKDIQDRIKELKKGG